MKYQTEERKHSGKRLKALKRKEMHYSVQRDENSGVQYIGVTGTTVTGFTSNLPKRKKQ